MMSWFRVGADMIRHRKIAKLADELDVSRDIAIAKVIRLYSFAFSGATAGGRVEAKNPPRIIEEACDWTGEPGKLFGAFVRCGIIDLAPDGVTTIHDWGRENGAYILKMKRDANRSRDAYLENALADGKRPKQLDSTETFAETSVKTSRAQTDGRTYKPKNNSNSIVGEEDADIVENSSSPSPTGLSDVPGEADTPTTSPSPVTARPPPPAQRVFEHWRTVLEHPRASLDSKRRRIIEAALKLKPEDECLRVIDGCRASAYHMGENEKRIRYDSIGLLFRDADHMERFIGYADKKRPLRSVGGAGRRADGSDTDVFAPF